MTATQTSENPPATTPGGPLAIGSPRHAVENATRVVLPGVAPGPVAVIGEHVTWWGGAPMPEVPASLEALGALSDAYGIEQFWVHWNALDSLGFPRKIRANSPTGAVSNSFFASVGDWTSSRVGLAPWSYWWRKGGRGFHLHIPAYAAESPFAQCATPAALLLEVLRYERATSGAMPWRGAGSITSDGYLRRRLRDVLVSTQVPPPVQDRSAQEVAYLWHRKPGKGDRNFRYCHALDLNLSYAAPASSVELPLGEVELLELPGEFDKRVPGVHLFEVTTPWELATPPPWGQLGAGDGSGEHWVTTPTAERMVQLGYWPVESWVWRNHGRHLRAWYEVLRDAREALLHEGGPALTAVKQVCRQGLGRLSSERRTLREGWEYLEDDPAFQPYWDWAVIAELRCRLQRRLCELEVFPVAVDTDAVYFLSSRRDPETLARRVGLPFGDRLGQFKPHGTCTAGAALEALELEEHTAAVHHLREAMR